MECDFRACMLACLCCCMLCVQMLQCWLVSWNTCTSRHECHELQPMCVCTNCAKCNMCRAVCCARPDAAVLARMLEYLHILCTRLQRTEGLVYEEYVPVADTNQKWQPAAGTVVNYGKP